MKKILTTLSAAVLLNPFLCADTIVSHDQPYYTYTTNDVQLIYTEKNLPFARKVLSLESPLHTEYQQKFGFKMDERLYVGLTSDYNQIANGFSTQLPNNRQINYIGGTELIDYFSVRSWLETLIYHETAHNYQLNSKNNAVSHALHSVFGNGFVLIPFFTLPNFAINSFILEGNAVLNESWHGNGGRLYNGRFLVQTLLQVKEGLFTPQLMHNWTLRFPYGEHFYTMGGQFQYYLAKTYGLDQTNRFFQNNSIYFVFPFLTNQAMTLTVGKSFEAAMNDYVASVKQDANDVVEAKCKVIEHSQFFSFLNRDRDEVFFIINRDGASVPQLVRFNRLSGNTSLQTAGFLAGKVIKANGDYYTQGSNNTTPFRIYQGLYDRHAIIKPDTVSKMIQGYFRDGTPVYFDVPTSYDHPRLFVGTDFYADVNSSVFIDDSDNLYYFTQNGKTRTLYRNKTALTSFQGFYGFVSDVDSHGNIYVIANSRLGSTLYRITGDKNFERVLDADNIIDARLINDDQVLIAATSATEYYYGTCNMKPAPQSPYETTLYFENEPYYGRVPTTAQQTTGTNLDTKKRYHALTDMHYSGTDAALGYDSEKGFLYDVQIRLEDPFEQSALTGFAFRNTDQVALAGISYQNTQSFLRLNLNGFGMLHNSHDSPDIGRRLGFSGAAQIPILERGYWNSDFTASYTQDYASNEREPLAGTLSLSNQQQYGKSLYYNSLFHINAFALSDRGDEGYGSTLDLEKGFSKEWYFAFGGKAATSNTPRFDSNTRRGIKFVSSPSIVDLDPSLMIMPSLKETTYAKSAAKGYATLRKVFNYDKYFFTFPLSLRREAVFATYNYYSIDNFGQTDRVQEGIAGITFDTLLLNNWPIPITVLGIYNNNSHYGDKGTLRVSTEFYF